ncbi:MAG: hypothetical protein ABJ381_12160, partial [Ilumatobacter sp.]|uniref:hypothetical protein n=1 Tax=Ilumatobacter sp. TaxID=1967498 RepID=UPI00329966E6
MTVIAVCSTRSSPGATSLGIALGAAFAHRGVRPLLIEADPAGGVIGLRFAMSADPSLRTLWADMRRGFSAELVQQNSADLRGVDCLLAPTDPALAARALEHVAPVLAREVGGLRRPVVIDLGRLSDSSPALPLVACATHVPVVTRPRVEDVQSLLYGTRLLEAHGRRPSIVSIGDGPHHPAEVATLAGLPLAAVLPDDRTVASAFTGGRYVARSLRRSTLWRCVDALAGQLIGATPDEPPTPPRPRHVDRSAPIVTAGRGRDIAAAPVPPAPVPSAPAPPAPVPAAPFSSSPVRPAPVPPAPVSPNVSPAA